MSVGTEKKETATTDEACPCCGCSLHDLWDYYWGHNNYIEITCPECNQEIAITADIYYIITKVEQDREM